MLAGGGLSTDRALSTLRLWWQALVGGAVYAIGCVAHASGLLGHPLVITIIRIVVINRSQVFPIVSIGLISTDLWQVNINVIKIVLVDIGNRLGVCYGCCLCHDHILIVLIR